MRASAGLLAPAMTASRADLPSDVAAALDDPATAADVVAFAHEAGVLGSGLRVVGHSWGGMTSAALPGAGLIPDRLVLLDPPAIPVAAIATMLDDPVEGH